MRRALAVACGIPGALLLAFLWWAWAGDSDPDTMWASYGAGDLTAEADGFTVRYRVSGPADAPRLLMIHGTTASLETWEPLRERLDDDYRIIAYDQPGHGLTGPHPDRDYTYDGMAEAIEAVLDAEGAEEAVLVGNSMGGWVAWRHALARPDQVAGLVLIDASGIPPDEDIPSDDEVQSNIGFKLLHTRIGRAAMQRLTPRAAIEASLRQSVSREEIVTDEAVDRYWEMLRYPGNRQAAGDQFTSPREELAARLAEITQPTLVLWGREDPLVPVGAASAFAERMTNATVVVYDGVGHLPMEEVPDAVAADIERFLATELSRNAN